MVAWGTSNCSHNLSFSKNGALFFGVGPSYTEGFHVPDTGQTTCYDGTGTAIACPAPGQPLAQDGSYDINPLSYNDNGDGTVTDNNTGLVWQKNGDANTYNWYQATGTYDATYNPSSENVCGSLGSGWRLPTKKELLSIVDYSVPYPGPTIRADVFPNTTGAYHWSSTTVGALSGYPFQVFFNTGDAGAFNPAGVSSYVKCVRGSQLQTGPFTTNSDGTVTDSATGLVWQQGEAGQIPTWEGALNYCENLPLAGKTDWRLPNIRELESIVDDTKEGTQIDTSVFPGAQPVSYWSSTTYASDPTWAWLEPFFSNGWPQYRYPKSELLFVRCVRGGQTPATFTLTFPIDGLSPYNARVTSVLDHTVFANNPIKFYTKDNVIRAFDGETGDQACKDIAITKTYSIRGCRSETGAPFLAGILNYTGGGEATYLWYDGHPGYDYGIPKNTLLLSTAPGKLYKATKDLVNGPSKGSAWNKFHTFYIDHGNGYSSWYLHASNLLPEVETEIRKKGYAEITEKKKPVALSGDTGVKGQPHLHFEVRKDGFDHENVIDPYAKKLWE